MKINSFKSFRSEYKKNIYLIISYFFYCSFIGWIFETTEVFIRTGKMTERGLFFVIDNAWRYFPFLSFIPHINNLKIIWGLPIIEIYGIGGCIIVFTFGNFKRHPILLFFIGMFFMTLVELISSYFCEYVLNQQYWDYSTYFLNFQGRICLVSSIAWGLLSVLTIKYIKKYLKIVYTKEKHLKYHTMIINLLVIYSLVCIYLKYFQVSVQKAILN